MTAYRAFFSMFMERYPLSRKRSKVNFFGLILRSGKTLQGLVRFNWNALGEETTCADSRPARVLLEGALLFKYKVACRNRENKTAPAK